MPDDLATLQATLDGYADALLGLKTHHSWMIQGQGGTRTVTQPDIPWITAAMTELRVRIAKMKRNADPRGGGIRSRGGVPL